MQPSPQIGSIPHYKQNVVHKRLTDGVRRKVRIMDFWCSATIVQPSMQRMNLSWRSAEKAKPAQRNMLLNKEFS